MEKKTKISNFPGLYREDTAVREKYFFVEKIKTRCADFDWRVDPHIHSYLYQIFYVKEGNGEVHLNAFSYKLQAPFLVFIPPNYMHGFSFCPNVEGDIISFSNFYTFPYLNEFPSIAAEIAYPVLLTREYSDHKESINIVKALRSLGEEYFEQRTFFKDIYIHTKLASLLLEIASLNKRANTTKGSMKLTDLDYFQQFLNMIKTHTPPLQPIKFYTKNLGLSFSHLNRLCQAITNDTPLSIIQHEIISMARVLLLNDKLNVSDVAYSLGFNDPSYFTRLFKKRTGMTPKKYKLEYLGKGDAPATQ